MLIPIYDLTRENHDSFLFRDLRKGSLALATYISAGKSLYRSRKERHASKKTTNGIILSAKSNFLAVAPCYYTLHDEKYKMILLNDDSH